MAALCATIADLSTPQHGLVAIGHARALVGALAADGRAKVAGIHMPWRATQHEVGAGRTDLCTVEHQPDMVMLRMSAPER
ncbi:MAG TPA: hypothetical protein VE621_00415 [Bryobacteraceae bacterium]|nr:hypothetical protein [Bryobacteraceae bacterium]